MNMHKQIYEVERELKQLNQQVLGAPVKAKVAMCKFFLQGTCRDDAASCRFAHDPSQIHQGPNAKSTLCKFFLQGKCLNGQACTFAHSEADLGKGKG